MPLIAKAKLLLEFAIGRPQRCSLTIHALIAVKRRRKKAKVMTAILFLKNWNVTQIHCKVTHSIFVGDGS